MRWRELWLNEFGGGSVHFSKHKSLKYHHLALLSCWVHLLYRLNSTLCYCLQPDVTPLLGHKTPFSDISIHQAYRTIYVKTSSSKDANGKTLGKCITIQKKSRRTGILIFIQFIFQEYFQRVRKYPVNL